MNSDPPLLGAYETIASNYTSRGTAKSGSIKHLNEEGQIVDAAPQKTALGSFSFGGFLIKHIFGSSNRKSESAISNNNQEQSSAINNTTIGQHFYDAIEKKYTKHVAESINKKYQFQKQKTLSEKEISRIIKTISSPTYPARLNQNNWKTIETTIEKKTSGLESNYKSTLVPIAEILQSSYKKDDLNGVCSRDWKNSQHTINGWSDSLNNGGGKKLFSCVRSGVLALLDPDKKQETFDNRLNENILAALHAKDGKIPTDSNSEQDPIGLSLVDIGLLDSRGFGINERDIQTAQFKLLSNVNNNTAPRAISYTPPDSKNPITIYVKLQIRAINIGTHSADSVRQPNVEETDATISSVLHEIKTCLNDQNKKITQTEHNVINELHGQCTAMHSEKIYLTENEGDDYVFHARFAALCYKMGMIPMIHCKSGTNRTSRAVEEAKLLIAEIDSNVQKYSEGRFLRNNLVPPWGKLDQPGERAAAAFFVGVGTQELQQTNSGDAGSSEGHSVTKRIPNFKKAIEQYKGVYADWKKALMKSYRSQVRST